MYGGTKEEMQRLIADAAELSDTVDAQSMSFDNIVEAIHVVQTEMGITGTTAKEAGTTIQGSVASMKSAWTNLLTGLANGNADIEQLVDNLVTTVVGDGTESNLGVLGNILPAVETALKGASALVGSALPQIMEIIPTIINDNLPILAEAAVGIIQSLMDGISENQANLFTTVLGVITYLAKTFITMLPQIVKLGLDLIVSLANGIAESLPELIPTIVDVVMQIVETLIANVDKLIIAALEIMLALNKGLIMSIPQLIKAIPQIIMALVNGFGSSMSQIINVGKDIVNGLKKGIQSAWNNLVSWFTGLFGDLIGIAKKILGIASPSKVFKKIGGFTAEGFGVGFEDEFARVKGDIENAMNVGDVSVGINASVRKVGEGTDGTDYGSNRGVVSVVQNIYSEAKTAADLMQEALYQQERAVLLGV